MSTDYKFVVPMKWDAFWANLPPCVKALPLSYGGCQRRCLGNDHSYLWVCRESSQSKYILDMTRYGAQLEIDDLMQQLADHYGVMITDYHGAEEFKPRLGITHA